MMFVLAIYIVTVVYFLYKYHRHSSSVVNVAKVAVLIPIAFISLILYFIAEIAASKQLLTQTWVNTLGRFVNKLEEHIKNER